MMLGTEFPTTEGKQILLQENDNTYYVAMLVKGVVIAGNDSTSTRFNSIDFAKRIKYWKYL